MTILLDGARMQRALINLINNAIDASENGQNVVISEIGEERSLRITINDKGGGMDQETLENLFVPFFTNKRSGTGLGMPIAKKIIEGHNGSINIESRPGKGTNAIIRLPV
jgi:signal transduction histidine kinase